MRYIAALDYEHLDNGLFLSSLAQAISQQKKTHSIIVHGDSAYTERVMQTGVMREQAKIRSIKDLNHRLIALFADQGVSAIGINGYQRKFIVHGESGLSLDTAFFERLPRQSVLLLSTLVWDSVAETPATVELSDMVAFLHEQTESDAIFAFSSADKNEIIIQDKTEQMRWDTLPDGFAEHHLPGEFHAFNKPLRLTTARDFHQPALDKHSIFIQ